MKDGNIIRTKSYQFAVRVVNLYKLLVGDRKEFVLSKQLLRSGTSIGEMLEKPNMQKVKPILSISCQLL